MTRRKSSSSERRPMPRPPPTRPKPPDLPNLLNLSSSSCTGQAASGFSSELDSMDSDDEPDPDAETLDPQWFVGVNSRRSKTSLPLTGIKLEVVKTNAKELASTVDINSLVWIVLGVRDPIYATLAIVKEGLTATDVFAVKWIQTGVIHFGLPVSYYGFVSDVLELWYTEPSAWDIENSIELPDLPEVIGTGPRQTMTPRLEEKWVVMKGQFLGIMGCNHFGRTVQSSQVVTPNLEDDDGTTDMLLVHGCGRLRWMRFFLLLQTGQNLSLPYVECVKVKSSSPVKPLPPFGELLITGYGPSMVNLRRTLLLFVTNICGTHRKFNKVPFVRVSNRYCSIHSPPRCFLFWLYRLLRIQHLASTFPPLMMPSCARRCYLRGCFPGIEARRSFNIECSYWFSVACSFDGFLGVEARRSLICAPWLHSSWMKCPFLSIAAAVAVNALRLIRSLSIVEESLKIGDVKLGDMKLGDMKNEDVKLGDMKLGDMKFGDFKLGDMFFGDMKIAYVKLGDMKLEDVKIEDWKLEEMSLFNYLWKRFTQSIVAVVAMQAPLLIRSLLRFEESLKLDFKMIKIEAFLFETVWIFFTLSFTAYVYVLVLEPRASEIWMTLYVTR